LFILDSSSLNALEENIILFATGMKREGAVMKEIQLRFTPTSLLAPPGVTQSILYCKPHISKGQFNWVASSRRLIHTEFAPNGTLFPI
jgi:hypothetical protein